MNPLTWQNPGQLFVAQDVIKVNIYSVAELRAIMERVHLYCLQVARLPIQMMKEQMYRPTHVVTL